MSKVQSPKSISEPREGFRNPAASQVMTGQPDSGAIHAEFGLSTLDFGLRVTDLRKSFLSDAGVRIEVLRGVSFSAQPGEVIAIVGSSGAGKSTLLHLMAGFEEPDHGSVIAGEFALHSASKSELSRFRNRSLGVIFQFHHLLPELTALENVTLPLLIGRKDLRVAVDSAKSLLGAAGLGDRSSHLITDLSGGEQQRVAVCRALITRPNVVLADEPTGNLDNATGDVIAASLISYAKERGATIVVATHNQGLAALCDRRLLLTDGRLREA